MPWMFVLGNAEAIAWVIEHRRMAVNSRVATLPEVGDRVALYATRGAYRNPTRDRAQVIGLGEVTLPPTVGQVVVAGRSYAKSFGLRIDLLAEPRQGLAFEALVPKLSFITNKASWGGAVRRPVVSLPDSDYELIESGFRTHRAQQL